MRLHKMPTFYAPAAIDAGAFALSGLPQAIEQMGKRYPMVLSGTDRQNRRAAQKVLKTFGGCPYAIAAFSTDVEFSDDTAVSRLSGVCRDIGCDVVIAVGSEAQLALAAAVCRSTVEAGKENRLQTGSVMTVWVPTGAEGALWESALWPLPDRVVIDPEMMTRPHCVPSTAAAAFQALTLAVQTGASAEASHGARAFCDASLRLLSAHLAPCLQHPNDASHWVGVLSALAMAAAASQGKRGIVWRIGLAVSNSGPASIPLTPGLIMGVLLPHALAHPDLETPPRLGDLLLPLAGFELHAATPPEQRARQTVRHLSELVHMAGRAAGGQIPLSLKGAGMDWETLKGQLTTWAASLETATSPEALQSLLFAAWEGRRTSDPDKARGPMEEEGSVK